VRFNTVGGAAVFTTKDGTIYTAVSGVFTIGNATHQVEATMVGMTPMAEATDPPAAVASVTAEANAGGDAEVGDSAAAVAALAAATNTDTQMPPE